VAHALLRAVSPLLATPGFWGFNALGYQSFRTTRVVIERWLCTTVVFNGSANAIEEVDVDRSELLL